MKQSSSHAHLKSYSFSTCDSRQGGWVMFLKLDSPFHYQAGSSLSPSNYQNKYRWNNKDKTSGDVRETQPHTHTFLTITLHQSFHYLCFRITIWILIVFLPHAFCWYNILIVRLFCLRFLSCYSSGGEFLHLVWSFRGTCKFGLFYCGVAFSPLLPTWCGTATLFLSHCTPVLFLPASIWLCTFMVLHAAYFQNTQLGELVFLQLFLFFSLKRRIYLQFFNLKSKM